MSDAHQRSWYFWEGYTSEIVCGTEKDLQVNRHPSPKGLSVNGLANHPESGLNVACCGAEMRFCFLIFSLCLACVGEESPEQPSSEVVAEPGREEGSCICPAIYQPVCANEKTYGNSCEAECAGITEFSKGECATQ